MSTKLSEHSVSDLRAMLRATELSAGVDSVSARLIRRELDRKLADATADARSRPVIERRALR